MSEVWRRRLLGLLRDGLILVVLFAAIHAWKTRGHLATDTPLPEGLTIYTLDGTPVPVASFAPAAIQLHVWATWCRVCGLEHGTLNRLHERVADAADRALVTVAVSSGSAEELRAYVEANEIAYPVYVAGDAFVDALGVSAYPTNYYVSAAGTVRATTVGASSGWGMRWRLHRAASSSAR
jgi:peroxiredoxin